MPKVSHFRELHVWQRGMDVVEAVYRVSCGVSEERDLRAHGTDSAGGGVCAFEYCGGAYARVYKGVSESPVDRPGFVGGSGNAIGIGGEAEVCRPSELQPVLDECVVLGKQLYKLRDALLRRG